MKYNLKIDINHPRKKVVELFDNSDNMKHWQPGLVSFEPLGGTPGEVGAQSKLKYKMGKREIEMVETITARNLPDEFSGTYEAKGAWNEVKNYFTEIDESTTRWTTDNELKLSGFMKVMGWVIPGALKKESYKYLNQFKTSAEK